jgi:hypothetical protein
MYVAIVDAGCPPTPLTRWHQNRNALIASGFVSIEIAVNCSLSARTAIVDSDTAVISAGRHLGKDNCAWQTSDTNKAQKHDSTIAIINELTGSGRHTLSQPQLPAA